jgi:hypothetical protein
LTDRDDWATPRRIAPARGMLDRATDQTVTDRFCDILKYTSTTPIGDLTDTAVIIDRLSRMPTC